MQLAERIRAFSELGLYMADLANTNAVHPILQSAQQHNGWFTHENLTFAIQSWSDILTPETLEQWVQKYPIPELEPKTVAIVMAGNIPLVGFHDFLSVLMAGHKVMVKLSSNDKILLPHLAERLIEIEPRFSPLIVFNKDQLSNFDAVIATGSNNTALYFEHYFGKYPNIIRKNRNSVAVLTGEETKEELELLANDIFMYFGLGCRNVSKLFLPKDYNFDLFFNAMYSWKEIINNDKYINNYDYNKAVYLMSDCKLLDNEFMLLKEDTSFSSPISVVFYEYYEDTPELARLLMTEKDQIQCVIGNQNIVEAIPFGNAQKPSLFDYADGIDTLQFLLNLH